MSTDISRSGTSTPAIVRRSDVSLSKWVNERLPAWNELLGAHEVARLTRRHRWALTALALLGRFPKPQRFRGRAIGWRRRDVEHWLLDAAGLSTGADSARCSSVPCGRLRASTCEQRRDTRRCARRLRKSPAFCGRGRQAHASVIPASSSVAQPSHGESMELPLAHDRRVAP